MYLKFNFELSIIILHRLKKTKKLTRFSFSFLSFPFLSFPFLSFSFLFFSENPVLTVPKAHDFAVEPTS